METVNERTALDDLFLALRRLDSRLAQAQGAAQAIFGDETWLDPLRGLHISPDDAARLLQVAPGIPLFYQGEQRFSLWGEDIPADSPWGWLAARFDLSLFDLDVLLIALAPELDLRYERLYGYLQDDVTRRHPSVDLVLNLLCASPGDKLERRAHFGADGPLLRHGLVALLADPAQLQPPLLAHFLKLDDQIVALLLGETSLDRRLAPFAQVIVPPVTAPEPDAMPSLPDVEWARLVPPVRDGQPLLLYFYGPDQAVRRRAGEALAQAAQVPVLAVDLPRLLADGAAGFEAMLHLCLREAGFKRALLYLDGLDALRGTETALPYQALVTLLDTADSPLIVAGSQPWTASEGAPGRLLPVPFSLPDFAARRASWQASLDKQGAALSDGALDVLADRFQLTVTQIDQAAASAYYRAPQTRNGSTVLDDLFRAAREQSGHHLAALARKIEPVYAWDDIVLPADALAQLREICLRVMHRRRVLDDWGFHRKLSYGKGIHSLFAGPSGTGKTMAAEIIAGELGLDLYKIDLSQVVSKYIGETEKNLDLIFRAAEPTNAILFFDEADALFGKRSEVRDAHDRYANVEIGYLLQKMDEYEGITILATNLRRNMDEAFMRRLTFTVSFPLPEIEDRLRIWERIWPAQVPLVPDLDLSFMARQFKLSGGSIKNIALAAAFLAADDGQMVRINHLIRATRREYQKLGKVCVEADFGPYYDLVRE